MGSEAKRWNLRLSRDESDYGSLVSYDDHARAMAEKDEEIGRLRAELKLQKSYADTAREASMEIRRLKTELGTASGMYDGMRRRLRERKDQLKEAGRWSSHD